MHIGQAEWGPDPTGRFDHRYWDGNQWTDHVAKAGVSSLDVFGPASAEAGPIDPDVVPIVADSHFPKNDITALASEQLERAKGVCSQIGLTYVELTPCVVGVGIAIGSGDDGYTVLSIMAGGAESQLIVTSGIVKDIGRNRDVALETVNRMNQGNSSFTSYLHDAEEGWSLLLQRTTPFEVFVESPGFLEALVRGLPVVSKGERERIAQETTLGGRAWAWSTQDRNDLLVRSMF